MTCDVVTWEEQDEGGDGEDAGEDGTPVHAARPHEVRHQHLGGAALTQEGPGTVSVAGGA